jgi:trk system potassium uptake protein TrkH
MGQLVILILIQLGGIGYMTCGSFIILTTKKEISEERANISKTVFSLHKNVLIDKLIRSVILFTLSIEAAGIIALTAVFIRKGVSLPVWQAVFHSISAFCTAGFSLFPDSFMGYMDDFWVNTILSLLSFSGAIGFIVFVDIWRRLRGKSEHMTLTSQIIIRTIAILTAAGTVLIFLTESSMQTLPVESRLLASFFQAMTAITTVGFNTVDISLLTKGSLLLMTFLMVIGAAPSGTGGGLKTTTLTAIIGVMKSALRGRKAVIFWKARIPEDRVITAVASLGFYLSFLFAATYLLPLF